MHVIVIGAGLLGVTTAYFLREHGADVTVVDSAAETALGASYGNGGYYQRSIPDPWNAPGVFKLFTKAWLSNLLGKGDQSAFAVRTRALPGLVSWGLQFLRNSKRSVFLEKLVNNMALSNYTQDVLEELLRKESLDYSRIMTGGLILFRDEQSMAAYLSVAEYAGQHGCRFEMLDKQALLQREPALTEIGNKLVGAAFFPDDGAGNPRAFCQQLAAIALRRGVVFEFDSSVRSVTKQPNGVEVATSHAVLDADAVVIAAGAGSTAIAKSLGVHLPIAPAKGYSITIPMRDWDNRPSHVIADMDCHAGVNPMGDHLRVAGTAEFTGLRPGITPDRTQYLIGLARQLFPSFAATIDVAEIDPWGGHRPLSADGNPMIGETQIRGVYVNSGHGGLGFTQAPGSSKALADLVMGVRPQFDLAQFSLSRFGAGNA